MSVSFIAKLGRAGVAGLPKSKHGAQLFLDRLCHPERPARVNSASFAEALSGFAKGKGPGSGILRQAQNDNDEASYRRRARHQRGGGFEYSAAILPEAVRLSIHQYDLTNAHRANPSNASSPKNQVKTVGLLAGLSTDGERFAGAGAERSAPVRPPAGEIATPGAGDSPTMPAI